jgi:hypothetical protein
LLLLPLCKLCSNYWVLFSAGPRNFFSFSSSAETCPGQCLIFATLPPLFCKLWDYWVLLSAGPIETFFPSPPLQKPCPGPSLMFAAPPPTIL